MAQKSLPGRKATVHSRRPELPSPQISRDCLCTADARLTTVIPLTLRCPGGCPRELAARDPRERLRFDVARRSRRAGDAPEQIAEAVIELLDVGQHARAGHGWGAVRAPPFSSAVCGALCGKRRNERAYECETRHAP